MKLVIVIRCALTFVLLALVYRETGIFTAGFFGLLSISNELSCKTTNLIQRNVGILVEVVSGLEDVIINDAKN